VPRPALLFGALSFSGKGGFQEFITAYYYYVLAIFIVSVFLMWVIVHSPFGKALQGIRDNEVRARFLGLRIRRFRWISFLVSGTFTGVAGILWVPLNGLTTPDVLYWTFSGEIVFTALLGGFRTLPGRSSAAWSSPICGPTRWPARSTGSSCSAWCWSPWYWSCRPASSARYRAPDSG